MSGPPGPPPLRVDPELARRIVADLGRVVERDPGDARALYDALRAAQGVVATYARAEGRLPWT